MFRVRKEGVTGGKGRRSRVKKIDNFGKDENNAYQHDVPVR